MITKRLEEKFEAGHAAQETDMWFHFPLLRDIARDCNAVVELGMAIDACRLSEEETRKAFMLKWGDVFGFDCHDFEQIMSKLVVRQNSITPFLDKLTLGFEKAAKERP